MGSKVLYDFILDALPCFFLLLAMFHKQSIKNHKQQKKKKYKVSPVQVSHLLLPITKRLHYFYANQALYSNLVRDRLILYIKSKDIDSNI